MYLDKLKKMPIFEDYGGGGRGRSPNINNLFIDTRAIFS